MRHITCVRWTVKIVYYNLQINFSCIENLATNMNANLFKAIRHYEVITLIKQFCAKICTCKLSLAWLGSTCSVMHSYAEEGVAVIPTQFKRTILKITTKTGFHFDENLVCKKKGKYLTLEVFCLTSSNEVGRPTNLDWGTQ